MVKKYQNMNSSGTTTCGIIIDYENKSFQYYPVQSMDVCHGKKVSKKRIKEFVNECIEGGFTELPVEWGGKTFYGTGREPEDRKELLNVNGKDIDVVIDTAEHPGFRLELVADECAFYVDPGDDVLVFDLNKNEIMEEEVGLRQYRDTMDSIVNKGRSYEYGDAFILTNGKWFIDADKGLESELDKKVHVANVVKRNSEEKEKEQCEKDKVIQADRER